MERGPSLPPSFNNGGHWNITVAIDFELRITLMIYLDFQGDIVLHNFIVCVVFFKIVWECRSAAL